jgi:hypothetical protein
MRNTNQQNKGLISEDRRNKSTLPLTIPRSLYKSSAKDPVPAVRLKLRFRRWRRRRADESLRRRTSLPGFCGARLPPCEGRQPIVARRQGRIRMNSNRRYASTDSGLEAFSHNPTDGSFSPLAFRPRENTNYLNRLFLSY